MSEKKDDRFQLTEIFTAKAGKDWSRYFHGTIKREKDDNGRECFVRSKIIIKTKIHEGFILSTGKDQWELGLKLDELVLMVLDKKLHESEKVVSKIFGSDFNFN